MNYVGTDIHKRYSVCAAQDEQGRELGVMRIEGRRGPDFGQFLRDFGETSRVAIDRGSGREIGGAGLCDLTPRAESILFPETALHDAHFARIVKYLGT